MLEITKLISAVSLTMVIELAVLFLWKIRDKRLWLSLPINACTNILLNTSLSFVNIAWLYYVLLFIGEGLVFLVEWRLYELIKKDKKNWLYSLTANASSFVIGSLIMILLFSFI